MKTEEYQSDILHLIPPEIQSYLDELSDICKDLKASRKGLNEICFNFKNDAITFTGIGITIAPNLFQYLYKKVRRQLGIDMTLNSNTNATTTSATNTYTTNAVIDNLTWTTNTGTTSVGNSYTNWVTTASPSSLYEMYDDKIKDYVEEILNNKEKDDKKKMAENFSFGPYSTSSIRISPYGMAIKNKAGKWISYNKEKNRLMDVDVINVNIDASKIFYKVPRAISTVKPGDIILHNDSPVFVEVVQDGRFTVINPYEGTEITILPAQSPFGFDYVTTIISLTDYMPKADEQNPFGNLLPFMLMGKDNNNLGLMLALSGNMKDMDPMMMMALCGGSDMSTLLMLSMMNKKDKKKEFTKAFNKRHATYGAGIEDKDE